MERAPALASAAEITPVTATATSAVTALAMTHFRGTDGGSAAAAVYTQPPALFLDLKVFVDINFVHTAHHVALCL